MLQAARESSIWFSLRLSGALSCPQMASPNQIGSAEGGSQQLQGKTSLPNIPSAIQRYGLAVVSVALALLPALLLQHYKFYNAVLSLFLFATALTAWYAGVEPAALSTVLSALCFIYFFAPPIYSFAFTVADVPAIVMLASGFRSADYTFQRRSQKIGRKTATQ